MDTTTIIIALIAALVAGAVFLFSWNKYRPLSFGILAWFLGALGLMLSGVSFFQKKGVWTDGDLIGYFGLSGALMGPVIVLLVAWKRSTGFTKFLDEIPTSTLVFLQVYRFGGALYLMLYLAGQLPLAVGFVTGVLDITVATGALLLGGYLYSSGKKGDTAVLAWNGLGLLDLLIALNVITLSVFGLIQLEPAPTLMGMPPITLICTFQVPMAIFIHIYLIRRVMLSRR